MIDQDDIRLLQELTAQQRDELMGTSPARTFGSEPNGEVAATSSPANFEADSEGSVAGP